MLCLSNDYDVLYHRILYSKPKKDQESCPCNKVSNNYTEDHIHNALTMHMMSPDKLYSYREK